MSINITHSDIVDAIRKQFEELHSGLNIYIDDEQNFTKDSEIKRNTIYIAIHFNEATVNFAASVMPITLIVLGVENCIKPAQNLLYKFVNKLNNTTFSCGVENVYEIRQLWRSPVVMGNFTEVEADFRSLFSVSGTLLVGNNIVDVYSITYYYYENNELKSEDTNFLSFTDSLHNSLEPQPFLDTNGFAISEAKFMNYTFSFNTYLLNTKLVEDIMRVKGFVKAGENESNFLNANTNFLFEIEWTNGFSNFNKKFKLSSCQQGKNIGDIPTITLVFTH